MDYTILGRTGLNVSVIGVGTGGPSRVGLRYGGGEENAVSVIKYALENGVNFVDTAEAYRTEEIVAQAMEVVPRDRLVISTKISETEGLDAVGVERAIEERLRLLRTDYIDVCHFHAVTPEKYDNLVERAYPGLAKAREAGKIRFTGITEMFNSDPGHRMLQPAVSTDLWDVVMVGFNLLNQSARDRVLKTTRERGIGVLAMFAVRVALSKPQRLREVMSELIDRGEVEENLITELGGSREDPLGWAVDSARADSLVELAYRFVRHDPGIDVTLSGTGSVDHLRSNIASALKGPLEADVVAKLRRLFERVDSVTAQ